MEIEDIEWDLIDPDKDNPNEMSDGQVTALKEEISKRGFMQPCLVRPHPETEGRFQMIDGEHRWRVLGELGAATVPCVVDRETTEDDATIRTITMNHLRGQPVPIRMAHLLADLSQRIPESELRARLDLSQKDLQNYLALGNFLDEGEPESVPRPHGPQDPDDRIEIAVVATQGQADRIAKRLTELTKGDHEKEPAVIARKAREWAAA